MCSPTRVRWRPSEWSLSHMQNWAQNWNVSPCPPVHAFIVGSAGLVVDSAVTRCHCSAACVAWMGVRESTLYRFVDIGPVPHGEKALYSTRGEWRNQREVGVSKSLPRACAGRCAPPSVIITRYGWQDHNRCCESIILIHGSGGSQYFGRLVFSCVENRLHTSTKAHPRFHNSTRVL